MSNDEPRVFAELGVTLTDEWSVALLGMRGGAHVATALLTPAQARTAARMLLTAADHAESYQSLPDGWADHL